MRLLVVTNDYSPKPGGIQQWLGNVVDHFPGEVRVLAPADGPAATQRGEAIVRRNRRSFMWPSTPVTRWVIGEIGDFGPDAVLFGAPHPLPAMIPRLRAGFAGPIGVMTHGAEVTLPAAVPILRQLLARTLRRSDALLAVSRYTAGKLSRLTKRAVTTVGAGVDPRLFTPATRPQAPIIGCVSRFVPRKGQDRLIEVAGRLRRTGLPTEVLLVGRGRIEKRLRRLATIEGVPVRFEIDVPWEALPDLYRQMSVFAMPSQSRWAGLEVEGLGIVYLEAAASGLPVITGDSGGAPEAVIPGVTGFVTHDDRSLFAALQTILDDPHLADQMGAAGRAWVESEHTWETVAGRVRDALAGG